MPKLTQAKAMTIALKARGYRELTAMRFRACTAFKLDEASKVLIFVGSGGSLRYGKNRTSSQVCSAKFKLQLLEEGGYNGPL